MESPADQENWQLYVRALDLTTGKTVWSYKQVSSKHYGPGVLSTAGGILFSGEQQGQFTALDAKTGKVLWHFNTGQGWKAGPMTYSLDGNQYVGVLAGSTVLAFTLR